MSWEFDVFISYARSDGAEFVEELVGLLRQAGISYWRDIEQMPPGQPIDAGLLGGLAVSRHVIAVITEQWLARDYTTWEIASAHKDLRGERTLIPVALQPFDAKRLGPFLHRRNVLLWRPDDAEPDARFWQLYCALRQEVPGPPEDWPRRGREVRRTDRQGESDGGAGRAVALLPATPAEEEWRAAQEARWGKGRTIYSCDRERQWHLLEAHAGRPENEILFVTGPRGEGHELFLAAVQDCYPSAPRRWIREVKWQGHLPPRDKEEYLRALAAALPCRGATRAEPGEALRSWLRDRNLILVHRPVLPARLRDEALVDYYTRWLPELLPEPGTATGVLKVIQGIQWTPPLQGFGRLPGLFRRQESREVAEALAEIHTRAAPSRLPVVLLPELAPITREHLEAFIDTLPRQMVFERRELLADLLAGTNSSDILQRIVERLCAAEETS